jgi:SRSO17 transposase
MSLLDHPKAQALLADAQLSADDVAGCRDRLTAFLQRYLPLFYRHEQRELATVVLEGRLSGLERKTSEPIATQAGRPRKPVQHFVGAGKWDDEAVMAEVRRHAAEQLGHPDAVLVLDGSGFPKKGAASCGVARQWCGRLGKVENCQVGVFLAYAAPAGHAPLDRQLYLPQDWAADRRRRRQGHVPRGVPFQEGWRIGLGLLDRSRGQLPHGWVAGDDEFGRASAFRAELRRRRERYVLDVPANTRVRDLEAERPGGRVPPFERADAWAARQPASRWRRVEVRDGEKGRLAFKALAVRVQAKEEGGRVGPSERLLVLRAVDREPRTWYALSNAGAEVPLAELARAKAERHRAEQVLQEGKGEVGLAHYEVRSWVGWHHHMTLALLALWFLQTERRRLGGKNAGADGGADARRVQPAATAAAAERAADRGRGQRSAAA